MIKSQKKLRELASVLKNKNSLLISEFIESLRDAEPFEGAIGLLTSFYNVTENLSLRKTIENFMNDLKDQSVSIEVINEIKKKWNTATITMLVASCWQSGLNYSDHSMDIAKIYLQGNYLTAIECFTVIERSAIYLKRDIKDKIIKLIEGYSKTHRDEKEALSRELVSMLRR